MTSAMAQLASTSNAALAQSGSDARLQLASLVGLLGSGSADARESAAGALWSLAVEPLLSPRTDGCGGERRFCLYITRAQKFLSDIKSIGSMRSSNRVVELLVVRTSHWKLQDHRAFFLNSLSIWQHDFGYMHPFVESMC